MCVFYNLFLFFNKRKEELCFFSFFFLVPEIHLKPIVSNNGLEPKKYSIRIKSAEKYKYYIMKNGILWNSRFGWNLNKITEYIGCNLLRLPVRNQQWIWEIHTSTWQKARSKWNTKQNQIYTCRDRSSNRVSADTNEYMEMKKHKSKFIGKKFENEKIHPLINQVVNN